MKKNRSQSHSAPSSNSNPGFSSSSSNQRPQRDPNAIATRAYELWEKEGTPHGHDQDHWYRAEQELSGSSRQSEDGVRQPRNTDDDSPAGYSSRGSMSADEENPDRSPRE